MNKVLVGMSGGVDSSMAAYLLKEAGYGVEGLSLILYEARGRTDPTACCSLQAIEDAARTASHMGIPHRVLDARGEFIERVIEPFVESYTKGLTPNPCILCNLHIKFPLLMREADRLGADLIATGHYAKTEHSGGCSYLKKGVDPGKDQSYVLYVLRQEELKRLVLPLGGYTKAEIRARAVALGLPAGNRPESQEICFVEDRNYFKFIDKLSPVAGAPGPILDLEGRTIGTHKGIHNYTIGQRKRLGLQGAAPLFVINIDILKNSVTVGPREAAMARELLVRDVNWLLPREEAFRASVKIRSMMRDRPATVFPLYDARARVLYDKPQWAPAPGQSAVFYEGDTVVGGGVIEGVLDPSRMAANPPGDMSLHLRKSGQ